MLRPVQATVIFLVVFLGAVAVGLAIALPLTMRRIHAACPPGTAADAACPSGTAADAACPSGTAADAIRVSGTMTFVDNVPTVVTAYYDIPSKRPKSEYMRRIDTFFRRHPCNLVVFTSPDLVSTFKKMRGAYAEKTRIVSLPFEQLTSTQDMAFWARQKDHDTTMPVLPELYAIWAEKVYFLERALAMDPFKSSAFIWLDAGIMWESMVSELCLSFPSAKRLGTLNASMVHLLEVVPFLQEDRINPYNGAYPRLGGGCILVHRDNVVKCRKLYELTRANLLSCGRSCALEEYVLNLMHLQRPDFVALVHRTPWQGCSWTFMLFFLSDTFRVVEGATPQEA